MKENILQKKIIWKKWKCRLPCISFNFGGNRDDKRNLEVFEVPEALEDGKTICFWMSLKILIDEVTFEPKVLSDSITKYEDPNFYQDKEIGIDLDF